MNEILAAHLWLLESKYFHHAHGVVLAMLERGQGFDVSQIQASRRRSERYGEDGLPQMFYAEPSVVVIGAGPAVAAVAAALGNKAGSDATKVAVVPIQGPLLKNGGFCTLGTKDIAQYIQDANRDPNVAAIVLDIDSPGGSVDGTEYLGDVVAKSEKPVVAYVDGIGASAAYWVASQSSHIMINSDMTGYVGSIGVLAVHTNYSEYLAKMGQHVTIFRSERAVDKARPNSIEPLTEELIAQMTAELSDLHEFFIETVQRGRGDKLTDKEDLFTGKMYPGAAAKKYGLVDSTGTLEDAINKAFELSRKPSGNSQKKAAAVELAPISTANSNINYMKFPKLSALFGFAANANQPGNDPEVTAEDMQKAEDALSIRDARIAELEGQLAAATAEKEAATAQISELQQQLAEQKETITTLEAWKKESRAVDNRQEDLGNDLDEIEEDESPNHKAAQAHLEEQRRIASAKAKGKTNK
jgi:signal peptide peptidase SppA